MEFKKGDRVRHKIGKFEGIVESKPYYHYVIRILDTIFNRQYFKEMDLQLPFNTISHWMKNEYELAPSNHKESFWVFYDKALKIMRLFGSVTALHKQQDVFVDQNKLTLNQLRYRLSKTREWQSKRYLIKECQVQRSKKQPPQFTLDNNLQGKRKIALKF